MRRIIRDIKDSAIRSAEQWVVECTTCGRAAPALEHKIVRAWASSKSKRILVHCTACNKKRWARLTKDPERANELRIAAYDKEIESLEHDLGQTR